MILSKGEEKKDSRNAVVPKRKVNPLSPPTTIELKGIQIHFPFRPYECQKDYMDKVLSALLRSENALLESPTGTGKTLCLLCSALAWQREQSQRMRQVSDLREQQQNEPELGVAAVSSTAESNGSKTSSRVPTIIYASRTHSQLSQVVRELRNTRYRPTHAVLGSREQMCVHPKVKKKHSTASDINFDCNRLGKERKCHYRNNLEGFTPPSNEVGAHGTQPVMDMEELVEMGKERRVCPFYHTRNQVENAELVLVPYNYLFDKDARSTTLADIPWNNAVVIFDEAHNLETFASDSASFELSSADVAGCLHEIQRVLNQAALMPDCGLQEENLMKLKSIFLHLEEYILNIGNQTAYSGEFIIKFFEEGAGIKHENYELFINEIRKMNDFVMDVRGTSSNRGLPKLEHFVQCVKRVYGEKHMGKCLAKTASYRVHVSEKQPQPRNDQGRTVSYWCFAPALAMQELQGLNVRSIIVTSGTLSPLPSYSLELGIPFPHTLENPHVIEDSQIHVRVFGQGVAKKNLSSSFDRRKDEDYYQELGNTLASLSKIVPMGMLVFFPSYSVMETCIEKWGGPSSYRKPADNKKNFFAARKKQLDSQYSFPRTPASYFESQGAGLPWKRLLSNKAVVVEPRSSGDLKDAISEFKRYLSLPKSSGVVLMGVCRGKISEGIDFAHDMSRAVVITGLPFPPAFDPKVKLKREFLDDKRRLKAKRPVEEGGFGSTSNSATEVTLSGHEWYTQQAHRAVNQAIGRAIRNRADYGAILLLDSRFGLQTNQKGLSKWVRPRIQKDDGYTINERALVQFYKDAEVINAKREEEANATKREYTDLKYEAEMRPLAPLNRIEQSMKVTVVDSSKPWGDGSTGIAYVDPSAIVAKLDVSETNAMTRKPRPELNGVDSVAVASKPASVSSRGVERHSTDQQLDAKATATTLLKKVSSLLTPDDQSAFRKMSVSLKALGDNKESAEYQKVALEVCSLLAKGENIDGASTMDHIMVFLFLRLQPKAYRSSLELASMKFVFDNSRFGRHCTKILEHVDYSRIRQLTATILFQLYSVDCRQNMSNREFLSKSQRIVKTLLRASKDSRSTLIEHFVRLIPEKFAVTVRTFAHELIANERVEQLKSLDRASGSRAENDSSSAKRKAEVVFNPYLKPGRAKLQTASKDSDGNCVLECAQDIENNGVFVQETPSDVMSNLQSNAPKDVTCQYCSGHSNSMYMNACGHIACGKCWEEWRERSDRCPTCRQPFSFESLSKVVFRPKPVDNGKSITLQDLK